MYPCPCCGNLTLVKPPPGTLDLCPVCYWVDDPSQSKDPMCKEGVNTVCLRDARANYTSFGAACRRDISMVRLPKATENPLYEQIRTTLPNGLPEYILKEANSLAPVQPFLKKRIYRNGSCPGF